MKTVTICGSMKFTNQMKKIAWDLECDKGYNVIQCIYNDENNRVNDDTLERIRLAHYKKIDLSDAIYVVDIDGYIGESVKSEIIYAQQKGKEAIYHSHLDR